MTRGGDNEAGGLGGKRRQGAEDCGVQVLKDGCGSLLWAKMGAPRGTQAFVGGFPWLGIYLPKPFLRTEYISGMVNRYQLAYHQEPPLPPLLFTHSCLLLAPLVPQRANEF